MNSGIIRLTPAIEFTKGKKVIHAECIATIIGKIDSMTCDISIDKMSPKRVYISDLKTLVVEYHKKPMPPDRSFQRGYSLSQYNHDMALYEASRRTIILNPKHWQESMDKSMVNKKINFTDDGKVANFAILNEMKK